MSLSSISFLAQQCARAADPAVVQRMLAHTVRCELEYAGGTTDPARLLEIIEALLVALGERRTVDAPEPPREPDDTWGEEGLL